MSTQLVDMKPAVRKLVAIVTTTDETPVEELENSLRREFDSLVVKYGRRFRIIGRFEVEKSSSRNGIAVHYIYITTEAKVGKSTEKQIELYARGFLRGDATHAVLGKKPTA